VSQNHNKTRVGAVRSSARATATPPGMRVRTGLESLRSGECGQPQPVEYPSMRLLVIGSRFTLHASSTLSATLVQLRFTHRDLFVVGPSGVRPCWAHQEKWSLKGSIVLARFASPVDATSVRSCDARQVPA
jgi:hypothetical protein